MDKNKLKLTFLLTATIVPIALASWYFSVAVESGIGGTTNKGQLISPIMELTTLDLREADGSPGFKSFEEMTAGVDPDAYDPRPWQLLFMGTETCDRTCEEQLYFLRQVHIRLAGEYDRVERVYVQADTGAAVSGKTVAEQITEQESDMRVLFVPEAELQTKLKAAVKDDRDPVRSHYIFVADPLGNIMLYFTPENTPDEILSDLDKLLDHSSLG